MTFRLLVLILGLWMSLKSVYALPYPTETDLKAAYCAVVNKSLLDQVKPFENISSEMKNQVVRIESMVKRLVIYSQQRLDFVDAGPMISAMKFATQDIEESDKIVLNCIEKNGGGVVGSRACSNMPETDLTLRFRRCNSINWLPF